LLNNCKKDQVGDIRENLIGTYTGLKIYTHKWSEVNNNFKDSIKSDSVEIKIISDTLMINKTHALQIFEKAGTFFLGDLKLINEPNYANEILYYYFDSVKLTNIGARFSLFSYNYTVTFAPPDVKGIMLFSDVHSNFAGAYNSTNKQLTFNFNGYISTSFDGVSFTNYIPISVNYSVIKIN
jgi:hypothetical protein